VFPPISGVSSREAGGAILSKGLHRERTESGPICDIGCDELGALLSQWLALSFSGPQTHNQ
jgi:hypothetical protein